MASKMPPVPPAARSAKGQETGPDHETSKAKPGQDRNLAEQGRQGNINQNTTNQGYQQDR